MNISGRLIDAFLALEESKRFAVAAERCNVSASAFSQMITRLEEKVGAKLFDRNTRNVSLTSEGEIFSKGAHRIANEITNSINELRDRASCTSGKISIAAPPSIAASWLPKQFSEFRNTYPGIKLALHDVVSDRCLEMISSGEVDFGLNARSELIQEFDALMIAKEKMHLICNKSHPLSKKNKIRLKDLNGETFIDTIRTGSVWQQLQGVLKDLNLNHSGLEVSQFSTLAGLVAQNFGISIVPQFAVQLCKQTNVIALPIEDTKAIRPIYLIKRKGRSLSTASQAMWNQLAKNANNLFS